MDELKKLLSCLNENTEVKDIEATFKKIADILLFNSYIKTDYGNYRMMEIEFYFKNKNHKDEVTIERTEDEGMWWLNEHGVDLSFRSNKSKEFYGGILIRSIIPLNDRGAQIADKNVICGPQKSCWWMFYSSALVRNNAPEIVIINKNERFPGEMGETLRHIPGDKPRVNGNYRFYVKVLGAKIESGYSASPWK